MIMLRIMLASLLYPCVVFHVCASTHARVHRLRSPKAPDDTADMGSHEFCYAVMPHKGN